MADAELQQASTGLSAPPDSRICCSLARIGAYCADTSRHTPPSRVATNAGRVAAVPGGWPNDTIAIEGVATANAASSRIIVTVVSPTVIDGAAALLAGA